MFETAWFSLSRWVQSKSGIDYNTEHVHVKTEFGPESSLNTLWRVLVSLYTLVKYCVHTGGARRCHDTVCAFMNNNVMSLEAHLGIDNTEK